MRDEGGAQSQKAEVRSQNGFVIFVMKYLRLSAAKTRFTFHVLRFTNGPVHSPLTQLARQKRASGRRPVHFGKSEQAHKP